VVQRPDRRRSDAVLIGVPQRLGVTESLSGEFRRRAIARIEGEASTRVVDYDPGHRPELGEIAAVALDDVPGLAVLCAEANADGLASFSGREEDRRRLILYGVALGRGDDTIVCFQQFTPRFTLKTDKLLYLIHRDGIYGELEEDGFAFDLDFDLFVSGGFAFAIKKDILERVLGYAEEVRAEARKIAQAIVTKLPMANSDDFVNACAKDLRFARKAAAIVGRSTFDILNLERVRDHATKHDVAFSLDDQSRIVFSNLPAERWLLLKLLDDDYLESSMTDSLYEVNSKLAR